jgi:hypothetical protein
MSEKSEQFKDLLDEQMIDLVSIEKMIDDAESALAERREYIKMGETAQENLGNLQEMFGPNGEKIIEALSSPEVSEKERKEIVDGLNLFVNWMERGLAEPTESAKARKKRRHQESRRGIRI